MIIYALQIPVIDAYEALTILVNQHQHHHREASEI